jgi:hypothetical protein
MSETKVITSKVRFSYCHVFEPHSVEEGGTKKYSVVLLIPKKDKKLLAKIQVAIEAAIEDGKVKLGGKIPKNLKTPLRDGDDEKEDDENYAGMMFISANSHTRPGVVDENVQAIIDREDFYSGCYGRASINFYAFNTSGNKGIACGLNNVQKLEDGERLSGGSSAEEDFGDVDDLLG